ncbi:hypothetical protein WICPIJ_004678 [Wickerhamomyces pijperi]|uniref:Uncharacterized protein n=1 Tax=Wickerhamomyces pijperi TaxID=599730 RepID=A0A9P8TMP0_WICPI|nr:hypothetical protein WICPIJ_004678 [Wickerhamomyces pijperi]
MYNSSNNNNNSKLIHPLFTTKHSSSTRRMSTCSNVMSSPTSSSSSSARSESISYPTQFSLNQILEEESGALGNDFEIPFDARNIKDSRSSSMSSTVSSVSTSFNTFLMDEQQFAMNQQQQPQHNTRNNSTNTVVQPSNTDNVMSSPKLVDQGTMLVPSLSTISLLSLNANTNTNSPEQQLAQLSSLEYNSPTAVLRPSLNSSTEQFLMTATTKASHSSRGSSFSNQSTATNNFTSQQTQQHFHKQRHPSFTNYYSSSSSHKIRRPSLPQSTATATSANTSVSTATTINSPSMPIVMLNPQTPHITPSSLNNSPSGYLLNQTALPSSLQRTPTLSRVNTGVNANTVNDSQTNYKGMTIRSPKLNPIYSDVPMTPLTLNTPLQLSRMDNESTVSGGSGAGTSSYLTST